MDRAAHARLRLQSNRRLRRPGNIRGLYFHSLSGNNLNRAGLMSAVCSKGTFEAWLAIMAEANLKANYVGLFLTPNSTTREAPSARIFVWSFVFRRVVHSA